MSAVLEFGLPKPPCSMERVWVLTNLHAEIIDLADDHSKALQSLVVLLRGPSGQLQQSGAFHDKSLLVLHCQTKVQMPQLTPQRIDPHTAKGLI